MKHIINDNSNCYTSDLLLSGEFSKICGIPKSALHYYVSLGLLKPVYISTTNYKYYSTQQTYTIHLIQILQKAGCSLEEIQNLLTNRQELNEYLRFLDDKEARLIQERDELNHTISMLRTIHYFTDYSINNTYQTPTLHHMDKKMTIFLTKFDTPVKPGTPDYAKAYTKHLKRCDESKGAMKYPIGSIMSEHNFLFEEYQYSAFFSLSDDPFILSKDHINLEIGQYVFYIYKGLPSKKQDAYRTLSHDIASKHYTIISDIYELDLTNSIPLVNESSNTILFMVQICE